MKSEVIRVVIGDKNQAQFEDTDSVIRTRARYEREEDHTLLIVVGVPYSGCVKLEGKGTLLFMRQSETAYRYALRDTGETARICIVSESRGLSVVLKRDKEQGWSLEQGPPPAPIEIPKPTGKSAYTPPDAAGKRGGPGRPPGRGKAKSSQEPQEPKDGGEDDFDLELEPPHDEPDELQALFEGAEFG